MSGDTSQNDAEVRVAQRTRVLEAQRVSKVRVFDFDPKLDLRQALDVIDAALDDEGLHLAGRWLQGFCPAYAVRFSGSADGSEPAYLRVIVPTKYIVPSGWRWDDGQWPKVDR